MPHAGAHLHADRRAARPQSSRATAGPRAHDRRAERLLRLSPESAGDVGGRSGERMAGARCDRVPGFRNRVSRRRATAARRGAVAARDRGVSPGAGGRPGLGGRSTRRARRAGVAHDATPARLRSARSKEHAASARAGPRRGVDAARRAAALGPDPVGENRRGSCARAVSEAVDRQRFSRPSSAPRPTFWPPRASTPIVPSPGCRSACSSPTRGGRAKRKTRYRAAIRLGPDFPPAYVNLAELLRTTRTEPAAEQVLRDGIVRNPRSAELHYALGLSLTRSNRPTEATAALKTASDWRRTSPRSPTRMPWR